MRIRFPWQETIQVEYCEEFYLDLVDGVVLSYRPQNLEMTVVTSNNYRLDSDHELIILNTAIVTTDFMFDPPDDPFNEEAWEAFINPAHDQEHDG